MPLQQGQRRLQRKERVQPYCSFSHLENDQDYWMLLMPSSPFRVNIFFGVMTPTKKLFFFTLLGPGTALSGLARCVLTENSFQYTRTKNFQ
eukprot:m.253642 g.253642  ORF g.253642 m.253642 type:complete len:91 (+) comp15484_c0_seq1:1320-1592(+)